jgi:hypothetical protein
MRSSFSNNPNPSLIFINCPYKFKMGLNDNDYMIYYTHIILIIIQFENRLVD